MIRLKLSERFGRAFQGLAPPIQKRTMRALEAFVSDQPPASLRFEKLKGGSDDYTIRVNRSFRVLLKREDDGDGEVYIAVFVGTHERVYRKSGKTKS